ncbi:extracellular solute-binding protein [Paenarthrobacter sp. DKR-5]|uniref:extracellular solute-binding protein n=1 Tax=Paenarthrobacter sp. DKR-5 TaxID=2835535 RepID=UPI001BDD4A61|nr:extracellular solute-binding protein [Paenarthrobacter sp. DKR-5]MBT1003548.1 extracellular solute-binding protein [Paenarthrobacter sp. DKR-5]
MKISRKNSAVAFAVGAMVIASATGCAPGSGNASAPVSASHSAVSKDVAAAGKVTLTVWDQNTDGGINAAQKKLNSEFEAKYPNVTINRVSRTFSDLKTTLKLALSSNTPPDVIQANQGYPDMGTFVQAGMLQDVNRYADAYGWNSRYPSALLDLNRFTPDGKTWHTGNLFGVSQTGEMVGVYYNKTLLSKLGLKAPTTLDELQSDMAAAKAAGVQALSFGNAEKTPGIHIFGTIQDATAGKKAVRDLVFNTGGKWTDPSTVSAAKTLADWTAKGYVSSGSSGVSQDAAAAAFGKGQSLFLVQGTWELATLDQALGKQVGFTVLNDPTSGQPATMGGEGLAWAVTGKAKQPDVAAAYIDFITNANASQVLVDTGNLPAVPPADWAPKTGSLEADIAAQWKKLNAADGLTPYLDYTTPTFFDTLTARAQNLIAGQDSPDAFTQALQTDYAAFQAKK